MEKKMEKMRNEIVGQNKSYGAITLEKKSKKGTLQMDSSQGCSTATVNPEDEPLCNFICPVVGLQDWSCFF